MRRLVRRPVALALIGHVLAAMCWGALPWRRSLLLVARLASLLLPGVALWAVH